MNVNIDITGLEIKTDRLLLRCWKQSDLNDFFEYAKVEGVGEMAGWPHHESIEASQMILDKFIEGRITFAIEYNGKVIGSLGIEQYSEELFPEYQDIPAREIGYVLSKDYWGMGIMPEAVKAVIKFLFENTNIKSLFVGHFDFNNQSRRVIEKCGFNLAKEVDIIRQEKLYHVCYYVINK